MVATHAHSAPLITIVGATGAQGGSVLSHLLASDKPYRIRGITRDPTRPNAVALTRQGVEMVKANLASYEQVLAAVTGATYVFGVTDYWQSRNAQVEYTEGKHLVDASLAAGVKLLLWSGLMPVCEISGGKYKVAHFDSKAAVTQYAKASGVPMVVVSPGYYMTNMEGNPPRPIGPNTYSFSLPLHPHSVLPVLFTPRDYGAYVREAIEHPGAFPVGSEVLAASEYISAMDISKQWGEVLGGVVHYREMQASPYQEEDELMQMMHFFRDFGYFAGKDIAPSQKHLATDVFKFKDFVRAMYDEE